MGYSVDLGLRADVRGFPDPATGTISYVVADPETRCCAIVDPVVNRDSAAGGVTHERADEIVAFVAAEGLDVEWLLETHVRADHLSAAPHLQRTLGGRLGIGAGSTVVQDTTGNMFGSGTELQRDGLQCDRLFGDGDCFAIGALPAFAMATPGHNPACMTFVVGDAAFVGDTLLTPDGYSARADFSGGDAGTLYGSIQKILALPDAVRLFLCHDTGPDGHEVRWKTTVGERAQNIHVGDGRSRAEFVDFRVAPDATLAMPKPHFRRCR